MYILDEWDAQILEVAQVHAYKPPLAIRCIGEGPPTTLKIGGSDHKDVPTAVLPTKTLAWNSKKDIGCLEDDFSF